MSSLLLVAVEEGDVGAGLFGFIILLSLLIVTFLLIRNMNGRLKRLPREFPEQEEKKDAAPRE